MRSSQRLISLLPTLFLLLSAASSQATVIYNGRPGARLVMHLYPGKDGFVRTSTLGQPYPGATAKRQLFLINRPNGKSSTIEPLSSDDRLQMDSISSEDWGLGSNGFTTKSGLSLLVRSPYQRLQTLGDDFLSRASTAPVFILDVSIKNASDLPMTGRLLIGMDHAVRACHQHACQGVTFEDLTDSLQPAGGALGLFGNSADITTMTSNDIVATFAGLPASKCAGLSGGLVWNYTVPAHAAVTRHLIFAGYTAKTMMSDCFSSDKFKLHYTGWWKSVDDVGSWGVNNLPKLVNICDRLEETSHIRDVSPDRRFVISQAVAEHLSDTHLLKGTSGRLVWMYSEAGFSAGYLSTVDLIPDTFLFNKQYLPWTLKMLVDLHSRYVVQDGLGAYVTHDVGATNFESRGNYGESGAGHRMPVEEITNYIHLLWLTWRETRDNALIKQHTDEMVQLLNSLIARDADGDGIPDSQSNMSESDTFDNGALIGNTKENTYLGLKVWSSACFLSYMLSHANRASSAARAADLAERAEKTLLANEKANGYFWTILDSAFPNHDAYSLWVTKGVLTPYIGGFDFGTHKGIESACAEHTARVTPLLRRDYGYAFDSVPTSRVTWQSQSLMIDLMARNYWGAQDLGVAGMMARSGHRSGVLNEFVGPFSGLAKDTEWPTEQVYSRMPSAIGWLPGVMPKAVHTTPILLSCKPGAVKSRISANSLVTKWKSKTLPSGNYFVKVLGDEYNLLSKRAIVTANEVRLTSDRQSLLAPQHGYKVMLSGVIKLSKPAPIAMRLTGVSSASTEVEISSVPTATRVLQERAEKLSVTVSSPRLRADGTDSLTLTAKLCDSEGTPLKLNGASVSISLSGTAASVDGDKTRTTSAGAVQFRIVGGTAAGTATATISSGQMRKVYVQIPIGGTVAYLVDVGRDGGAVMDSLNRLWLGDCRYDPSLGYGAIDNGGDAVTTDTPIQNTPDQKLYQTYRWSRDGLTYRFDTYQPGDYLVRMLFAETFFGTPSAAGPGEGRRIINATINGKCALTQFDVLKSAGGPNKAVDRKFIVHIDKAEPIIVRLSATTDCASLAGIEVRPAKDVDSTATRLP